MLSEHLKLFPEYLDDRLLIVCEAARPLFHDVGKSRQCILDHVESLICGHEPNLRFSDQGVNRDSESTIVQSIANPLPCQPCQTEGLGAVFHGARMWRGSDCLQKHGSPPAHHRRCQPTRLTAQAIGW